VREYRDGRVTVGEVMTAEDPCERDVNYFDAHE
jgi:hypothetical protein